MRAPRERFRHQNQRIDRVGAMNSAMIGMASSAAAVQGEHRTRIGAGVGHSNGAAALSVGVQHSLTPRAAMTFGGAFSGSERSAMVGIGVGL